MNKEEVYNFLVNLTKNMSREDLNNISKRFRGKSNIKDFLMEMVNTLDIKLNESIYLILHKMDKPQECPDCGNRCRFQTFLKGYTKYCGKCGLKHSAETTRLIMENKSKEEKRDIIIRTQESLKLSREQKKQEVIDISNLNRSDIKDYILQYIGSDPERIRGIGNHLLHKRPDIYQYLKNEQDKFGYDNNSAIIYMILNNMIEPPLCEKCKIHYCTFHFDTNSKEKKFSKWCTECGLEQGGVNANISYRNEHDGKSVFEIEENVLKSRKTLLETTGYEFAPQNPETMEKIKKSSNENNGGMGFGSKKVLEKINETMMENHDCTIWEFSGTEERTDIVRSNSLKKYGVTSWMKLDKYKKLFHNLYLTEEVIQNVKKFLSQYNLELISEYYNACTPITVKCLKCGYEFQFTNYNQLQQGMLSPYCRKCYPNIGCGKSQAEVRITESILSKFPNLTIENNIRSIIDSHRELDIYIPEKNLAIEYDGLYWHSSNDCNPNSNPKQSEYHYDKYRICKEKGIRLITIFENDPLDIIMSMIYHIINGTEVVDIDNFENFGDSGKLLIDNRFYSYEFLKDKDKYKVIKRVPPLAWFWKVKDHEFIRYDDFKESYCSDGSDPFKIATEYDYNWIYDCGYQIIEKVI